MRHEWTQIDTDLLVIGGGVAGSMAAVPALEAGLDVVICEKGRVLDNCGSVGCGVDHYLTIMDSGPEWDTPEFLIKHLSDLTDGIVDMAVAGRVIREMPRILRKIEDMGVDFKDPRTGDYERVRSFGLPGLYHVHFEGTDFKRRIGKHVRAGRAAVLMRTMAVQVLVEDNKAYGALAFNFRTGEWVAIRAKAVVMTTGDVNRISQNASGLAFDSWHFPYNTGDAQAMGFRVGASLANMEFVEMTLTPKGFSAQGTQCTREHGRVFSQQERRTLHVPLRQEGGERAARHSRRCRRQRISVRQRPHLSRLSSSAERCPRRHGGDTSGRSLHVARILSPERREPAQDIIEISISELSIRRSGVYFRGSGLAVDTNGETSVEALFAAGDCATVSGGISGAAVLGHIAGEGAVQRIRRQNGARPDIDWDDAEMTRERGHSMTRHNNGLPWKQFEQRTRQCVTDYAGVRRTKKSLQLALDTLFALAKQEDQLVADDLHGTMRVHESRNIRLNAEIMSTAALAREETRTGSAHRRLDFPETDDEKFRKFMVVDKGADGKARVKTLDSNLPLSAVFARESQSLS